MPGSWSGRREVVDACNVLPLWAVRLAAGACERGARVLRTRSPLTRDFIEIGRVSYVGDTTRMRSELLAVLKYPSFAERKRILVSGPS